MEEIILQKYFEEKMKQIDISKQLNISKYKVSRTVSKDSRYHEEKERRKKMAKIQHTEKTKRYITNLRKSRNMEYASLKQAHIQASLELSGGKVPIGNRAFRDWNSSAYRYDKRSKSYILKKEIIAGADVPRKIKW